MTLLTATKETNGAVDIMQNGFTRNQMRMIERLRDNLQQTTDDKSWISWLWGASREFKKFWRSYLYMVTHPKQCLRLLNFASKVLISYGIRTDETEPENNYKSTPADDRMIDIMCDIHISPISVFDDGCKLLQRHGIRVDYTSDQMHKLLKNMFDEIDVLWNLLLKRYESHWWCRNDIMTMEYGIEKAVGHIKTYSKMYETEFLLVMEQVEQLENRVFMD